MVLMAQRVLHPRPVPPPSWVLHGIPAVGLVGVTLYAWRFWSRERVERRLAPGTLQILVVLDAVAMLWFGFAMLFPDVLGLFNLVGDAALWGGMFARVGLDQRAVTA